MEILNKHSKLAEIPTWEDLKFTERFNEKWMEEQRHVGDELADRVVVELKERFPIQDPSDMLVEIKRLASEEGGVYKEFMDACYYVPDWADFKAMEPGAKLWASHTPLIMISLLAGGVLGSAFHVNAEPVFTNTGRFIVEDGVAARLQETGAILGLAPLKGECQPGGRQHNVIMKVRVLHAALRHWSLEKTGDDAYPVTECGLPINQEDMGFAMLVFSYLPVRGMLNMGVELTREQVDGLNLQWRYIAHVIGVNDAWICKTIEEQQELYYAFVKHQAKPGRVSLAALSLLDGSVQGAPKWATKFLSGTLRSLTARLGGTDFLQGLYLEERGNKTGYNLVMGAASFYNFLLKMPFGEKILYNWGIKSFAGRYADLGSLADTHGYGVEIHDNADIDTALKAQKEHLSKA